jgi:hypothetical protein
LMVVSSRGLGGRLRACTRTEALILITGHFYLFSVGNEA